MKYWVYRPDEVTVTQRQREDPFALAELQQLVGGYIEVHRLPSGMTLVLNDNRTGLARNHELSTIVGFNVFGVGVVCENGLIT